MVAVKFDRGFPQTRVTGVSQHTMINDGLVASNIILVLFDLFVEVLDAAQLLVQDSGHRLFQTLQGALIGLTAGLEELQGLFHLADVGQNLVHVPEEVVGEIEDVLADTLLLGGIIAIVVVPAQGQHGHVVRIVRVGAARILRVAVDILGQAVHFIPGAELVEVRVIVVGGGCDLSTRLPTRLPSLERRLGSGGRGRRIRLPSLDRGVLIAQETGAVGMDLKLRRHQPV